MKFRAEITSNKHLSYVLQHNIIRFADINRIKIKVMVVNFALR